MDDPRELIELRRALHRGAEVSEGEEGTARLLLSFLEPYHPDQMITSLGGHGMAAVFRGGEPGSVVLVRCELDGLPIPGGVSHRCGHDGHMAMVAGLAPWLRREGLMRGSVILLFQPAEEVGRGAKRVLADPRLRALAPDWAFALHNIPGFPLGRVVVREGTFASASRGLVVELWGQSSHASEPHRGRSPALAVAQLIQALSALPQIASPLHEAAQVTVIHARVGEVAFGTSPGVGWVMATLRSHGEATMAELARRCVTLAEGVGLTWGLGVKVSWTEEFPATVNDPQAVDLVEQSAREVGLEVERAARPFPWSEDFGHVTALWRGALFGLGAGEDHPALHHPDYDFPDELLPEGLSLLAALVRRGTET